MEANMLVLASDLARLTLNDEQNVVVFKNDGVGQVHLSFGPVLYFVDLRERGSCNVVRLRDRLACLVVDNGCLDVDVVDVGAEHAHTVQYLWAEDKDGAVGE